MSKPFALELKTVSGMEIIVNDDYSGKAQELREKARIMAGDTGNPFFRVLQILEHLRK